MSDGNGSLAGRTCVITGATSGIGRATARALSATGAKLILVGRREQVGAKLAAELPIGSGEIESAHRYIIQSRLKRAGTCEEVAAAIVFATLGP